MFGSTRISRARRCVENECAADWTRSGFRPPVDSTHWRGADATSPTVRPAAQLPNEMISPMSVKCIASASYWITWMSSEYVASSSPDVV